MQRAAIELLFVDDEAPILDIFQRGIGGAEYRVTTAASGPEALERLSRGRFDIMVTDLRMSPMGGLELTEKARQLYPAMDVMILTAFLTLDSVLSASKLGAYDFLLKPLDLVLLRSALRRCVERRCLLARLAHQIQGIEDVAYGAKELSKRLAMLRPGIPPADFQREYEACASLAEELSTRLAALKAVLPAAPAPTRPAR